MSRKNKYIIRNNEIVQVPIKVRNEWQSLKRDLKIILKQDSTITILRRKNKELSKQNILLKQLVKYHKKNKKSYRPKTNYWGVNKNGDKTK